MIYIVMDLVKTSIIILVLKDLSQNFITSKVNYFNISLINDGIFKIYKYI